MVAAMDTDGDGKVSAQEVKEYRKRALRGVSRSLSRGVVPTAALAGAKPKGSAPWGGTTAIRPTSVGVEVGPDVQSASHVQLAAEVHDEASLYTPAPSAPSRSSPQEQALGWLQAQEQAANATDLAALQSPRPTEQALKRAASKAYVPFVAPT